jgi:predicted O-methyltransferase YrrM
VKREEQRRAEAVKAVKISPDKYHSYMAQILKDLKPKQGAEIGVFCGDTSQFLLSFFPDLRLLCIDPYEDYPEHNQYLKDHEGFGTEDICYYASDAIGDKVYEKTRKRLSKYNHRCTLLRHRSHDVAEYIANESLDFAYIDGNHAYDFVKQDIADWYPKVKIGGVLFGHDVEMSRDRPFSVMVAVMESFGRDWEILSNFWIVRKTGQELGDYVVGVEEATA